MNPGHLVQFWAKGVAGGGADSPYVQKAVHPSILAAFKNVALQRHFDILQRHIVILQRHIDIWQRHMTSGSVI